MKVRTSELNELSLSWLLLRIEYPDMFFSVIFNEGKPEIWSDRDIGTGQPTVDREGRPRFIRASDGAHVSLFGCPLEYVSWDSCGPIIERERIALTTPVGGGWLASDMKPGSGPLLVPGPTPLIAAMRCFVASKLGDEVDVPDELL